MSDLSTSEPPHALLHELRASMVGQVGTDNHLTLRQMAVVLIVYLTDDPQTVRGLARHLKVSGPRVSAALNRLSKLGLVRRQMDPADRRRVLAARTEAGQAVMARLKASLAAGVDGPDWRPS